VLDKRVSTRIRPRQISPGEPPRVHRSPVSVNPATPLGWARSSSIDWSEERGLGIRVVRTPGCRLEPPGEKAWDAQEGRLRCESDCRFFRHNREGRDRDCDKIVPGLRKRRRGLARFPGSWSRSRVACSHHGCPPRNRTSKRPLGAAGKVVRGIWPSNRPRSG
jgi:hypothetical protein